MLFLTHTTLKKKVTTDNRMQLTSTKTMVGYNANYKHLNVESKWWFRVSSGKGDNSWMATWIGWHRATAFRSLLIFVCFCFICVGHNDLPVERKVQGCWIACFWRLRKNNLLREDEENDDGVAFHFLVFTRRDVRLCHHWRNASYLQTSSASTTWGNLICF